MTTKIKRSQVKTFIDTTPLTTETYVLIGDGVTTGAIAYNPKTTEEQYIHEDNATISLDSYAPTMPVTATAKVGDPAFEFLDALRIARAVLGDAETHIVNVWLYKTPTGTAYPAERQHVSIQFNTFGGDGGQPVRIDYTINYVGDPEPGMFDTADSSFTAD